MESAGIGDLLDAVISVDALGMHKPAGEVYRLAMDEFEVGRGKVSFQSSNGWDGGGGGDVRVSPSCGATVSARPGSDCPTHRTRRTLDELPAIVLP